MKFVFTLLLTFFSTSFALSLRYPSPRGAYPEDMRRLNISRIIEGLPAKETQFPHQAYLGMVTDFGSIASCGGTLISPTWVLTAAHCLIDKRVAIIRLGNVNKTTPGLILESWNFYYHEDFDRSNLHNDIGVIELENYVHTTEHIRPIRLPRLSDATKTWENVIATTSGWGATTDFGYGVDDLHYVDLKIISNAACEEDYGPVWIIDSTICGAGASSDSQGACFGDSGGPLIAREKDGLPTLIGVVSFVNNIACSAPYPSGFARVGSFLNWITNYVEDVELRP